MVLLRNNNEMKGNMNHAESSVWNGRNNSVTVNDARSGILLLLMPDYSHLIPNRDPVSGRSQTFSTLQLSFIHFLSLGTD